MASPEARLLRLCCELCCPASPRPRRAMASPRPRRATASGAETKMKVVPTRQGHQVSGPTRTGHGSGGSAAKFMENDAPTPTHAEKSRTIIQRVGKGVLCTTHQELDYPYGSTINVAADEQGRPYTFVSTMAEHTANLLTSPKASIVVTEEQGSGDQLAQARMTLVGDMAEVEKTEELKQAFLALHNEAFYVDFDDFLCMRMEVKALRWGLYPPLSSCSAPLCSAQRLRASMAALESCLRLVSRRLDDPRFECPAFGAPFGPLTGPPHHTRS